MPKSWQSSQMATGRRCSQSDCCMIPRNAHQQPMQQGTASQEPYPQQRLAETRGKWERTLTKGEQSTWLSSIYSGADSLIWRHQLAHDWRKKSKYIGELTLKLAVIGSEIILILFQILTDFAEVIRYYYRTPPESNKERLDFTEALRDKSGKVKCGVQYCPLYIT